MHSFIKYLYNYTRSSWPRGRACERLRFECLNTLLLYIYYYYSLILKTQCLLGNKKNHKRKKAYVSVNETCIPDRVRQFVAHLLMAHNLSNHYYYGTIVCKVRTSWDFELYEISSIISCTWTHACLQTWNYGTAGICSTHFAHSAITIRSTILHKK